MIARCRVLLLVFIACFLETGHASAQHWQAGFAQRLITPTEPMWMSGYGSRDRPADGKLTELWAKAMTVSDDAEHRFVLVTLDLVGIDLATAERITSAASQRYQLPRHAIVLSTTHTHSGPVVGENLKAMYRLDQAAWQQVNRYTDELVYTVVDLIGDSLADQKPADISWTVGRAKFAVNRRNNPEADVPTLRAADRLRGPVDFDVPILVIRDPATTNPENIRGIVCGYACHATVLSGYQWCGDWPGYAQQKLQERYVGATTMVWVGCGADINPLPRRDVELAKQYGAEIDQAVAAALEKPTLPISGQLAARYDVIELPFSNLPDREQLQQQLNSSNQFELGRARLLLEQWDRDGQLSETYPYPVQTWQLGNGPTWIFLGGEVVIDYALRLKFEFGAGKTWVVGYCNDVMAYIASKRVIKEGGYEGGGAMLYYGLPSPWAESIEEKIIAMVRSQVAELGGRINPNNFGGRSTGDQFSTDLTVYPDHQDLTVYRDPQGDLQPITNIEQWSERRSHILAAAEQVMGPLPEIGSLDPPEHIVHQVEDFEGFQRQFITYHATADQHVPAHLYLPTEPHEPASGKRPAVLALHPTSPLGKRVVAGEGPIENRAYAVELARRGYVVLAPDYPSFGDLRDYDFYTDTYLSGTMTAIVNHRRGVDLLQSLDMVATEKIGAIGHSLGGHNAIFLAVFEPRIKAVVSSCGWDPFTDYYGGKLGGWSSDRYMPRIRELYGTDPLQMPFDFPELIAALAPRACFSSSPLHDSNFSVAGVKRVEPHIKAVFELHNAADHFQTVYPDCEHDFPQLVRQQAYKFLDDHLRQ